MSSSKVICSFDQMFANRNLLDELFYSSVLRQRAEEKDCGFDPWEGTGLVVPRRETIPNPFEAVELLFDDSSLPPTREEKVLRDLSDAAYVSLRRERRMKQRYNVPSFRPVLCF